MLLSFLVTLTHHFSVLGPVLAEAVDINRGLIAIGAGLAVGLAAIGPGIGEGTLIGAGSTVLPGVKIGKWSTIGAGSIVLFDVQDNEVVVGNPARKIIK